MKALLNLLFPVVPPAPAPSPVLVQVRAQVKERLARLRALNEK